MHTPLPRPHFFHGLCLLGIIAVSHLHAQPTKQIIDPAYGTYTQAKSSGATESFEGDFPPDCWTFIDADGDGIGWFQYEVEGTAYEGSFSAASASWASGLGALTPDNYLVSPQIAVGEDMELIYHVGAQDEMHFEEQYGIYVSTSGNADPEDFTDALMVETLTDHLWAAHTIDMSAYAGQHIYIAFRHFGSTDQFYIKFDEITLPGEIIPCEGCQYPTVETGAVICGDAGWAYEIDFQDLPDGSLFALTNTNNTDTLWVDSPGTQTTGTFEDGSEVTFSLTDMTYPFCTMEIAAATGDCTVPCTGFAGELLTDFDDLPDGIPVPDAEGICEEVTLDTPVFGGQAYTLSDLPAQSTYIFSACTGEGAGSFTINYTVVDVALEEIVASWHDGDACSITFETGAGGNFVVFVNYYGYCGLEVDHPNGLPTLTCTSPDGISDSETFPVSVYPNPTSGELMLTTPRSSQILVTVYDALGRKVHVEHRQIGSGPITIDLNALENGLYILKAEGSTGSATFRVIKQ